MSNGQSTMTYRPTSIEAIVDLPLRGKSLLLAQNAAEARTVLEIGAGAGEQGPPGADGAQGPQGIQGVPGNDGAQGIQGVPGNDGAQGLQGDPGPAAAWGNITGTLSTQTDLQTALNGKQASGTYATGTGTASGTNTGDQSSIAGITGTIAQFNTACSDADFTTGGGTATGVNTGDQTTVSGNAGTATTLQTARNINGVSFNGSADITAPASGATLTGTTLAAGLIGTAGTVACAGNDARLSDARTPTTHNITSAHNGFPGGTTNFLRADGTFAAPGGGADPWAYVVLGSDFPTTSATAVDVTGLGFTPAANTRYEFEARLRLRTATTTVNARSGLAWPTGMTDGTAQIMESQAATGTPIFASGNVSAALLVAVGGLPNTTQSWPSSIRGEAQAGATPSGNVRVQLASETAGTSVTVKAGSFIRYRIFS